MLEPVTMTAKRLTATGIVLIIVFLLGTQARLLQSGVQSYRAGNHYTAFHRDRPLAGLEVLQYVSVLDLIRSGETNRALTKLENAIDLGIMDAKYRRPVLTRDGVGALDKVLAKVAEYRVRFPRDRASVLTNKSELSAWGREASKRGVEYDAAIDVFLAGFAPTNSVK